MHETGIKQQVRDICITSNHGNDESMKLVQKHSSPYNAASSDLVFHTHCQQFFFLLPNAGSVSAEAQVELLTLSHELVAV